MPAPLRWGNRWRLSVLWALQWAITGALLTYLPLYFTQSGLTDEQLGQLLAVSAVGLWVAPFVVGQVCDRWLASEKYLAISHFVGALTLVALPIAAGVYEQTGSNFTVLVLLVGFYAIAYFPTIPLASSITFRHLSDPDTQFGSVRIWGTVGWVLAGLLLSLWLGRSDAYDWLVATFPNRQSGLENLRSVFTWVRPPDRSDCFQIAALLSFALSSFCIFLPPTPPTNRKAGTIAPLETLVMFRDRSFLLLIAASFLLAVAVPFYTLEVPKLLVQLGYSGDWVPALMTIGQISEFPALILLPFFLKRYGLKATFAFGMSAWLVRYAFFALASPDSLVLSGIALHGVCHVFLIIVVQLYVDAKCPSDVRASAQNLFAFITMGFGMPLGFLAAGKLGQWCIDEQTGQTDFGLFFSVPATFVLVLLAAFWRFVELPHARDARKHSEPDDAAEVNVAGVAPNE